MQKFPLCNNNLELFLINKKYNFHKMGLQKIDASMPVVNVHCMSTDTRMLCLHNLVSTTTPLTHCA